MIPPSRSEVPETFAGGQSRLPALSPVPVSLAHRGPALPTRPGRSTRPPPELPRPAGTPATEQPSRQHGRSRPPQPHPQAGRGRPAVPPAPAAATPAAHVLPHGPAARRAALRGSPGCRLDSSPARTVLHTRPAGLPTRASPVPGDDRAAIVRLSRAATPNAARQHAAHPRWFFSLPRSTPRRTHADRVALGDRPVTPRPPATGPLLLPSVPPAMCVPVTSPAAPQLPGLLQADVGEAADSPARLRQLRKGAAAFCRAAQAADAGRQLPRKDWTCS